MIVELLMTLILNIFKFSLFPVLKVGGDAVAGLYNITIGSVAGVSQFVNAGFGLFAFLVGSAYSLAVIISLNTSLTILEIGASITWWVLGKIPFVNTIQKK